jgi:hypothetical protein
MAIKVRKSERKYGDGRGWPKINVNAIRVAKL